MSQWFKLVELGWRLANTDSAASTRLKRGIAIGVEYEAREQLSQPGTRPQINIHP